MRSKKPPSTASESGRSWAPTIGCWMRGSPPIEPFVTQGPRPLEHHVLTVHDNLADLLPIALQFVLAP